MATALDTRGERSLSLNLIRERVWAVGGLLRASRWCRMPRFRVAHLEYARHALIAKEKVWLIHERRDSLSVNRSRLESCSLSCLRCARPITGPEHTTAHARTTAARSACANDCPPRHFFSSFRHGKQKFLPGGTHLPVEGDCVDSTRDA